MTLLFYFLMNKNKAGAEAGLAGCWCVSRFGNIWAESLSPALSGWYIGRTSSLHWSSRPGSKLALSSLSCVLPSRSWLVLNTERLSQGVPVERLVSFVDHVDNNLSSSPLISPVMTWWQSQDDRSPPKCALTIPISLMVTPIVPIVTTTYYYILL